MYPLAHAMFCLFILLTLSGSPVQGSKKGIVECADMMVVNKADGDLLVTARHTAADYQSAVKWQGSGKDDLRGKWKVPVLLASAHENSGIDKVFGKIGSFRETMMKNGGLAEKRRRQGQYWMWKGVQELIEKRTKSDEDMRIKAKELDEALVEARITPRNAARELMQVFLGQRD